MATIAHSLNDLPGDVALQGASPRHIRPENDEGAVEYKLKLYRTRGPRFEQLVTQLRYRLSEGNGVAWYYLGVMDKGHLIGLPPDELAATFASLQAMARAATAQCRVERVLTGDKGQCLCAKVWLNATERVDFQDVRVAVAGSMDAGKSTLIAVLTHGTYGEPQLDNGHGGARTSVFRHKHELESGRTSSLARATLGYDPQGQVLNYQGCKALTQREIALAAATVVNFVDLGGHPRYLKTALFGLTCVAPHYMMLCCSVRDGLGAVGATHLAAALALQLPLILVLTKVDGMDEAALLDAQQSMRTLLEQAAGAAPPDPPLLTLLPVDTPQQAQHAAAQLAAQRGKAHAATQLTVPVLSVSSVSGRGLSALHALLGALQGSNAAPAALAEEDTLFHADREFSVEGVGRVMAGTVLGGGVSLGQQLLLVGGGAATMVSVSSIHRNHVNVEVLGADQSATLAIAAAPIEHEPTSVHAAPPAQPIAPTRAPSSKPPAVDEDDPFAGLMMGGFDDEDPDAPPSTSVEGSSMPAAEGDDPHPMSDGGYASSLLGSSPEADWGGAASAPTARQRPCSQAPRNGRPPLRTRSETHALRMRCADARGLVPLQRRGSNNGGHRGAVLLGLSRSTQLQWRIECLVVLWSGIWPPRGLVSGCWPPQGVSSSKDSSDSGGSGGSPAAQPRSVARRSSAPGPGEAPAQLLALHRQLLHAGQVRAEARVLTMREIMDVDLKAPAGRTTLVDWQDLTPLLRAARAMAAAAATADGNASTPLAVVARVVFEFVKAPQWVAPGTPVLVHDRSAGVLAAVGVVETTN